MTRRTKTRLRAAALRLDVDAGRVLPPEDAHFLRSVNGEAELALWHAVHEAMGDEWHWMRGARPGHREASAMWEMMRLGGTA